MADNKPIIIVKKKGGHGGHHGGAWKVAYADFVTAMMAFFMVMWLVNTAETTTKQNIASYFRKPGLFTHGSGTPLMIGEAGILQDAYVPNKKLKVGSEGGDRDEDAKNLPAKDEPQIEDNSAMERERRKIKKKQKVIPPDKPLVALNSMQDKGDKSTGEKPMIGQSDQANQAAGAANASAASSAAAMAAQTEYQNARQELEEIGKQIQHELETSPELAKLLGIVDVRLDADGLNIEIMDSGTASMFNSGSPVIRTEAKEAFAKIGQLLAKLNNRVDVVGHTDAKPFSSRNSSYSNWELSSDRANAARRLLVENGVAEERVSRVVGRADKELRDEKDPFDSANRRISLKIRYERKKPTTFSGKDVVNSINRGFTPIPEINRPIDKSNNQAAQPTSTPPESTTLNKIDQNTIQQLNAVPAPTTESKEVAHGYRPKQIVKAIEHKDENRIVIFDNNERTENPTFIEKDKIFKDSPVLGPPGGFLGQ